MAKMSDDGTKMDMIYWINDFCDALDKIGVHVDRDKLEELRHPSKAKSKKRKTVATNSENTH